MVSCFSLSPHSCTPFYTVFCLSFLNWLATAGSRDHLIKVWDLDQLVTGSGSGTNLGGGGGGGGNFSVGQTNYLLSPSGMMPTQQPMQLQQQQQYCPQLVYTVRTNNVCRLYSVATNLFSRLGRFVKETLWNAPSPMSSARIFVISSIGPLAGYIPKRFAAIVTERRHRKRRVTTCQSDQCSSENGYTITPLSVLAHPSTPALSQLLTCLQFTRQNVCPFLVI
ncbi:unnamed protein product [Protopolystoma xenopodis]|uniref:Uncharacterized protein n=1 Tax=Protopolystoma xenopodis TaxID=117903 RepID=A0A3S5BAJ0_9PLAT|nr:unnamed protein product [Protopolystoma xenopodis]